jgi:hypothetical protein
MSRKITKWTFEACKDEALKYKTRNEFQKTSGSSYKASEKNKWLDLICSHMIGVRKPKGYWTLELCREEALKYKNNKEFKIGSNGALQAAHNNGWINEINGHFTLLGNKTKRFIYAYEFPNNHVYVGLTYSFEERNRGHNTRGTVFDYIQETGLEPIFRELLLEPVSVEEAKILEEFHLQSYIDKGWFKLNRAKTGAIGGSNLKWTYEACKSEALKYNTRKEFNKENETAYRVSNKNGWSEEICAHMVKVNEAFGHWLNKENVIQEALKYTTKNEFTKGSSGAYSACLRYGWLEEACLHMKLKHSKYKHITKRSKNDKWYISYKTNEKRIINKSFNTEEEAYQAMISHPLYDEG